MIDANEEEELVDRLRRWLGEVRTRAEQSPPEHVNGLSVESADSREPAGGEIGIYRLVEEFTAMRHELKLQTRSARGLEEQTEALSAGLREALDALRSVEPKEAQAAWTAGKPLASALADLDEALERGRLQIERAGARLIDEPAREMLAGLERLFVGTSAFHRWLIGGYHRQVREFAKRQGLDERRALVAALVDGYRLVQNRLARALADVRIARISALGKAVDPEQMIVLEAVDVPGQSAGVVVEEVRPGYTWNGRLLRCAEVRASRGPPG